MLNPETNPYRNIKPIWTVFDTTELDAYVILYKCLYVSHLFLLSYNILQAVCSKFKLYITMLMGLISVRIILHILSIRIKCAYGWNRFTFFKWMLYHVCVAGEHYLALICNCSVSTLQQTARQVWVYQRGNQNP